MQESYGLQRKIINLEGIVLGVGEDLHACRHPTVLQGRTYHVPAGTLRTAEEDQRSCRHPTDCRRASTKNASLQVSSITCRCCRRCMEPAVTRTYIFQKDP